MSNFFYGDDEDNAKAIAIPRVFSKNSQANKTELEALEHLYRFTGLIFLLR